MKRRRFLQQSTLVGAGSLLLPQWACQSGIQHKYGVQLYSFRDAMLANPMETLKTISDLGLKEIETARSAKGHYYGLGPKEMAYVCRDMGMRLVSGHVHLDADFEKTMDEAVLAEQPYLICSSLPTQGQTVENYKRVAEAFNKAGAKCKKRGLKFGYHNHEYEFDSVNGKILYDVLMEETDPNLVFMELDLGWVIVAGHDPLRFFETYPGRFPLWHLKDMDMQRKESTEFGRGGLDIKTMLDNKGLSGVEHIFIEQEEYEIGPTESMAHNMGYLQTL